jgi:hypothetical protein
MTRQSERLFLTAGLAVVMGGTGCAGLGNLAQIIQPPRFEQAENQPPEIRIMPPSVSSPIGGAGVRIWLAVTNPNPFGFTLSTVNATLLLEGNRAATGDFPLGVPLTAGQRTVVPLDLSISFSDLPGLGGTLRQLAVGGTVGYQLNGTVGIDAGRFGMPTFGPMLLTRGDLRAVR